MNKGLAALKRIRQETCPATYNPDFDKDECCNIIESELKEKEEQDKVLKIIKNKRVDIEAIVIYNYSLEDYNCRNYHELTIEEYELIKKCFGRVL